MDKTLYYSFCINSCRSDKVIAKEHRHRIKKFLFLNIWKLYNNYVNRSQTSEHYDFFNTTFQPWPSIGNDKNVIMTS